MSRLRLRCVAILSLLSLVVSFSPVAAGSVQAQEAEAADSQKSIVVDWDRSVFYPQGGGYFVDNDHVAQMLTAYRQLGGVDFLGPPISRRYMCGQFVCQAFQFGIIRWHGQTFERGGELINILDDLHWLGHDPVLEQEWNIPPHGSFQEDGVSWPTIVANRMSVLESRPTIKAFIEQIEAPIELFGLPTSQIVDRGDAHVVRFQRTVIAEPKPSAPEAKSDLIRQIPAGELAKQFGLIPNEALEPTPAPETSLGERWILVDRSNFTVSAMVGEREVFRAPATVGKLGYETPSGSFSIYHRVLSETMDSATLGVPRDDPEGYYLENIRYTQYFLAGGFAIHENYWQSDSVFGSVATSHGCVGLRASDAKFFWDFAEIGTRVVVR